MDILQEVKDAIAQQRTSEKENKLEQLSSIFEYSRKLNKADVGEAVQILLKA